MILHLDDHLVAIDKPSGLSVHRGWDPAPVCAVTVVRDLVGKFVYPVHRLDRGASGVLVMALDAETARVLGEAFHDGEVTKRYWALVRGIPPAEGVIDHPIPRVEGGPRVPALSRFRTLASISGYSLVEVIPETGRLHQVRRHMKHIAHPLIGDVNYGKGEHNRKWRERGLSRLALHCVELGLPGRAPIMAPLPEDLAGPLSAAGFELARWGDSRS